MEIEKGCLAEKVAVIILQEFFPPNAFPTTIFQTLVNVDFLSVISSDM